MYSEEKHTRAFLIFHSMGHQINQAVKKSDVSTSSPPRRPKLLHIRMHLLPDPLQNVMHINWYFGVSSLCCQCVFPCMQSEQRAHDGEQKVCFFWWLGAWENHVRVHPSLCLWLRLLHVSLHYVKFFTVIFTHSALASASASVHRAGTNMLSQHRGSTQANLSHSLRGVEAEWVKR